MIEKFIADTEKLLGYIGRIEEGELACIGPALRLAEEQGIALAQVREAVRTGVDKKASLFLEKIREGEDIEVYMRLIGELVAEYNLNRAELEEKTKQAAKEAELRRFGYYVNMIENENIHLISKARALQRKYRIEGSALEDAIGRGEYAYLFNNIKQIKRGPRFHPLLPREEKLLRKLAEKYGHEEELEEAIRQWRALGCQLER